MGSSRFWLKGVDEENKSIPPEFPRSHSPKATGQCDIERYLSATMLSAGEYDPHYENTPMQYTAIFHSCKNDNFQLKVFDYFHVFPQNIACGLIEAVLTSTHNLCFRANIREKCIPL